MPHPRPARARRAALLSAASLGVASLLLAGCNNDKGTPPPKPGTQAIPQGTAAGAGVAQPGRIPTSPSTVSPSEGPISSDERLDTGTQPIEGQTPNIGNQGIYDPNVKPPSRTLPTNPPAGRKPPVPGVSPTPISPPASEPPSPLRTPSTSAGPVGADLADAGQRLPFLKARDDARRSAARPAPAADEASAGYALFCQSFTGPDHLRQAADAKRMLADLTGLSDWHAVHTADRSELYYGHYATVDPAADPAEARRAAADREAIRAVALRNGAKPFQRAAFVSLDSADPAAPAEWDLANAPGAFTLEIAAYTGPAEARKRAAVDSVRDARASGVEAYYYHGPATSSVSVGTFPESAVTGHVNPGADGDAPTAYSAQRPPGDDDAASLDSRETIVVSSGPIPESIKRQAVDEHGRPMKIVEPDVRYAPAVVALMRQYPQYFINGTPVGNERTDPATGARVVAARASMVVRIPNDEASALAGGPAAPAASPRSVGPAARVASGSVPADAAPAASQSLPPAAVPDLLGGASSRQGGQLKSYGR